jgi:hypothetical protein
MDLRKTEYEDMNWIELVENRIYLQFVYKFGKPHKKKTC